MTVLFSIGHSNHPIDKFLTLLHNYGIQEVVDVRSSPKSRWPQFGQRELMAHLAAENILYSFGGQYLGGKTDPHITVKMPIFVAKMQAIIHKADHRPTAIMCSEGKPCECHRAAKLMAYLHREYPGVETKHIMPDGGLRDARQYECEEVFADFLIQPEFLPTWTGQISHKSA